MGNRSVAVVGAGDHTGAAVAPRPAPEGYTAVRFGLPAVAQSMVREPGPRDLHVAYRMIASGVDTGWVSQRILAQGRSQDLRMLMNPASIGETHWQLHRPPREAWTHGPALRSCQEPW